MVRRGFGGPAAVFRPVRAGTRRRMTDRDETCRHRRGFTSAAVTAGAAATEVTADPPTPQGSRRFPAAGIAARIADLPVKPRRS
ncbi:hypothetical protein GCM10010468_00180 [Actinocorallia longicatena]|uniref:Uncharacterized protein n=1 Tax=Actinocorallia longicatena TaxID=111803 RepID=A0ABP6PV37_9ACTN